VRRLTIIFVAVAVLAGCAEGAVQDGAERWSPTPELSAGPGWDGRMSVDFTTDDVSAPGFNDFVESNRPEWAKSAATAGAQLLDLDRGFDGPVEVYLLDDGEVVTFTLTRLGDDSISAQRYRLVFDRGDDGLHRFVSGKASQKCQPDRGHQSFSGDTCQ
jgi:hypothetical protein